MSRRNQKLFNPNEYTSDVLNLKI